MRKMMKQMMMLAIPLWAISCRSDRHVYTGRAGTGYYEPYYKRDQRLEDFSTNRTESHGASGAGSGSSYSGSSYRQSAIEEEHNSRRNRVRTPFPETGRGNPSGDTLDTSRSW